MPLLCCDVGLVPELRLTAGCVLMDLASPAVSGTSVYANGKSGCRNAANCMDQGLPSEVNGVHLDRFPSVIKPANPLFVATNKY